MHICTELKKKEMPKQPIEDMINRWIAEEIYQSNGKSLASNVNQVYLKALLDIAGSDGILADIERKWVLAYGAARG